MPESVDITQVFDDEKDLPPVEDNEIVGSMGKTGRPRLDGMPVGSRRVKPGSQDPAYSVPNPHFSKYYSDDANSAKRTAKLWTWVKALPIQCQELIDVYVYRDWPPLLPASPEDDDFNNIDKFSATELWAKDEDMNDRYGAGDFHVFLNVGMKPHRRTIATAWVKGNRSFRDLPPSDKRITVMGDDGFPKFIDRADPQCKTYVEFLRSRGIIPEVHQAEKERLKMEQAETAQQSMSAVERMADKVIKIAENARVVAPAAAPALNSDTVKEVMNTAMEGSRVSVEMLKDTIKTLREGNGGGGNNDSTLETALKIAVEIGKANNPAEYLKIIGEQNQAIVKLQMDRLNDKIESLTRANQAPTTPTAPSTPVGGLKEMVKDFKELRELMNDGADAAAETAPGVWGVVERVMPHLANLGGSLLQMYMASQMRPGQMPPCPGNGMPMPMAPPQPPQPQPTQPSNVVQMQPAGLPAPQPPPTAQPNGTPGTPPAPGSAPDSQAILMNALNSIQVPISNSLHDSGEGDTFADWFIGGYGERIYQELVAYGEGALVMGLYAFPPIATRITNVPREQTEKFVHEFCTFDGETFDRKIQARMEREDKEGDGPIPVA